MRTWLLISVFVGLAIASDLTHEDAKHFTNDFAVEFEEGTTPAQIRKAASDLGFTWERSLDEIGVHHFSHDEVSIGSKSSAKKELEALRSYPGVIHVEQQQHRFKEKRGYVNRNDDDAVIAHSRNLVYKRHAIEDFYRVPQNEKRGGSGQQLFNDPLYKDQWYLHNDGQTGGHVGLDNNVLPAWRSNFTGKGVVVTILDDGVQYKHDDLISNFDEAASLDMNNRTKKNDPSPRGDDFNSHGTKCAGEIAAQANNKKCGVGIAYDSKIGGVRMLDGHVTDLMEAEAVLYNCQHIDIYSASWGPTDDGKTMAGPGKYLQRALAKGVNKCRQGKGAIYVWATGNGGERGDDCNADGYVSNVHAISIGSINENGEMPTFMEQCASTLGVVFTGGLATGDKIESFAKPTIKVVTTDINNGCVEDFQGTSAAAPLGAGILALVLQANPNLIYRDIMHLITRTSSIPDISGDWVINGAGLHFNRRFGFGRLDAGKLVEWAQHWDTVGPLHICEIPLQDTQLEVPAHATGNVSVTTTACQNNKNSQVNFLEHVQLHIHIDIARRGNVNLTIVSPSGTPSVVLGNRAPDNKKDGIAFTFMTTHFWGEKPEGKWTVIVGNNPSGFSGGSPAKVTRVGMVFYGTVDAPKLPEITPTLASQRNVGEGSSDIDPSVNKLSNIVRAENNAASDLEIESADQAPDASEPAMREKAEQAAAINGGTDWREQNSLDFLKEQAADDKLPATTHTYSSDEREYGAAGFRRLYGARRGSDAIYGEEPDEEFDEDRIRRIARKYLY